MKTNTTRDAVVGATAVLGVTALAVTLMLFGELQFIRPERYELTFVVPDANGLTPNAEVALNGVRIGRVLETSTGLDPTKGVDILLAIDEGVRIPREAQLVVQQGLLAGPTLALRIDQRLPDAPDLPESAYFSPGERVRTETTGLVDEIAGMLDSRLDAIVDASQAIARLANTYADLGEDLGGLVRSQPNSDAPSIRETIERLNRTLAAAETWLDDAELRAGVGEGITEARSAFTKFAQTAERWSEVGDTLAQAATSAGEDLDEGVARFATAADSLAIALEEIRVVALRVNEGEGTLGELLANPDLFRNLNDAAQRLDKALLEAQLLLEKYRKEGVPIQF